MQKLQDFLMSLLGVETEPTFIPILTLIRQMIIKDNRDTLSRKKGVGRRTYYFLKFRNTFVYMLCVVMTSSHALRKWEVAHLFVFQDDLNHIYTAQNFLSPHK